MMGNNIQPKDISKAA